MPPKKAAAKKTAAKKAPGHPDPKKAGRDTRRAYEHLGRVYSLARLISDEERSTIEELVRTSEQAMRSGQSKEAADLLRAGEHFAFGSLKLKDEPEGDLAQDLIEAVHEEYEHLRWKAEEHGKAKKAPKPVQRAYKQMRDEANGAFRAKRFRAALELVRGAEALAHIGRLQISFPEKGRDKELTS